MVARDLKYLLSYLLPLATYYSIASTGLWSFGTVILAFCFIPILELVVPQWKDNFTKEAQQSRADILFFDILLFLNVFLVFGLVTFFAFRMTENQWTSWEWIGKVLSLGIVLGSNGINVAHELGHKPGRLYQIAAQCLLWPSMYVHFTTEHNHGHHTRVGTPEDPATARQNEWLYGFWFRSIILGYLSAWRLKKKMANQKRGFKKYLSHPVSAFVFWPLMYPVVIIFFFDVQVCLSLICAALVSVLLLETINYIEHYGLFRERTSDGRYQTVNMMHSWNSNHEVGRVVLYELTRHSDHHYKAYKKYQNLNHFDESPQLPLGYPGSILLSLVPPLWFKMMNPLLDRWKLKMQSHVSHH